ncbi:MAG: lipopolysaccharide transport periplasmic protein LptA [Sulfurimonadaceae bacterium]
MKHFFLLTFFLLISVQAEQLKVVAKSFHGDEKSGITVFKGDVKITKGSDKLNADTVTIYTNAKRKPTKYVAKGNVSFFIKTENNSIYKGTAGKAVFVPAKKEYHFYENVHIAQTDEKKEIIGEEVIISTVEGKARAKGGDRKPVIMTFEIEEEEDKK